MNAIEFKDFSCYYKNKKEYVTALSHLDLTVRQGEFLVVVGESGCGKTTLIKACLGLADYFEGDLTIDNKSIEDIDLKSGKFAYVSQEYSLYPNLTIYENIAFPLRMIHTPQAEVDKRVKDVARLVDVEIMLTRKPRQISGGQQQRVAIGRALIKNPRYLFCDEPFSNVDKMLRLGLCQLVKTIHNRFGQTIVFVTHDLSEAFYLAERIVVLEDGKIVEMGTPEELKVNPKSNLLRTYFSK